MLKTSMTLVGMGFSSIYSLDEDGILYNTQTNQIVNFNEKRKYRYKLKLIDGGYKTITLKELYRTIYQKEFSYDDIQDLPGEEWRQVVIDKNLYLDVSCYFVSNMGRVKSYKRYRASLLKPFTKDGYFYVRLGDGKDFRINRLVALAFIPNPNNLDTVDHIDNNRLNNKVTNLQWLSKQDNTTKANIRRKENRAL